MPAKSMLSHYIQLTIIIIIVVMVIFGVFKLISRFAEIYDDGEYAKEIVSEKAKVDLGEEFEIISVKRNVNNFEIGCINEAGDCAILYIVKHSINKDFWMVSESERRTGRRAAELFNIR